MGNPHKESVMPRPIGVVKMVNAHQCRLRVDTNDLTYVDESCPMMYDSMPSEEMITPPPLGAYDDLFNRSKYGGILQ